MNLHITPSFKIDRLCKTAYVLLFLVMLDFLFCCCCVFTFCPKTNYLSQNLAISFAMLFIQLLNILQDLRPIKRA